MEFSLEFKSFVAWGFYSLLTGGVIYAATSIREDFKATTASLHELALSVVKLTTRLSSFEESLDRIDRRLEKLENLRDHNSRE